MKQLNGITVTGLAIRVLQWLGPPSARVIVDTTPQSEG